MVPSSVSISCFDSCVIERIVAFVTIKPPPLVYEGRWDQSGYVFYLINKRRGVGVTSYFIYYL